MDYYSRAVDWVHQIMIQQHAPQTVRFPSLPRGAYGILAYLNYRRDGASVGELTDYLRVTSGRTAMLLKHLEQKQYLRREQSMEDKRVFFAFITERGTQEVGSEYQRMVSFYQDLFERLGPDDTNAYIRIMLKLSN